MSDFTLRVYGDAWIRVCGDARVSGDALTWSRILTICGAAGQARYLRVVKRTMG